MSHRILRWLIFTCVITYPVASWAQQTSSIAGLVRDSSGAVLPGVTVEATSPALIEKFRTVVTDNVGQYKIVDLRPGTYLVTFTLPGFASVRQEGIQLTTGFTATVNAEMRVGTLEETVTVTGASPLVDTQNVRQQQVISDEVLTTLPTATQGLDTLVSLIPGMTSANNSANVGGSQSVYYAQNNNMGTGYHGKGVGKILFDGMRVNNLELTGNSGYIINSATVADMTVETGGLSAESNASGVTMNMIPKEGSNQFRVTVGGIFANSSLQGDNLSDEIRARGLATANEVKNIHDVYMSVAGPIRQDHIWFFATGRRWGNRNQIGGRFANSTQGTPFYTPDPNSPLETYEHYLSFAGRATWQISSKNKLNVFGDVQNNCICRGGGEFAAPEAAYKWLFNNGLTQATWTSPLTNRLLLEAGASVTISHYQTLEQPETQGAIGIVEQSTGFRYNALTSFPYGPIKNGDRYEQRFAVSYVTGSHAFKAGVQIEEAKREREDFYNGDVIYMFNRGAPTNLTQWVRPYHTIERVKADLGVYVQDQWTFRRLTLNPGLRINYLNAYVPAQSLEAGPWVPARQYDAVRDVPSWTDVNPRLGASYDLLGNGRTALKVSLGRYTDTTSTNIAQANNPVVTSVNSVTRSWTDGNNNFTPDCDLASAAENGECGPYSNANFGKTAITTRYADDAIHGFGNRAYTWEVSAEVQHQFTPRVSVTGGYYRNWAGNFMVSDNVAVGSADFTPFCIPAPVDPRLPSGGGYQVCGMYDVAPEKFGQVSSLVNQASNYGDQTKVADFLNVTINTRFGSGIVLGGGVDTGRVVADLCGVIVDRPTISSTLSPYALTTFGPTTPRQFCRADSPWEGNTQVKFHGSYPLPGAFVVSGIFQNVSGPEITANYAVSNAAVIPSLGRSLAACGNPPRAGCTSTVTVPLYANGTDYDERRTQLDVRLSRIFNFGSRTQLQANVDVYNVLNSNAILTVNNTYGPQWRNVQSIMSARLVEFSGQFRF